MAKIKLTKTEQKAQQDALKQYSRFLPTLQLKKQQLQMEVRRSASLLLANEESQHALEEQISSCVGIFGPDAMKQSLRERVRPLSVRTSSTNVAGVTVPVFRTVEFQEEAPDLFRTDWAEDDGAAILREAVSLRLEHGVLEEQHRLLRQELRTTTQRVNLFEKVKIPECRENIRRIAIYLGDVDTAAVARSKIAKKKTQEGASL